MPDLLKYQILGEVEYAQHNFARLRPILYSIDGRAWTGAVDRAWFPSAGLVFSLAPELRYAQAGSMWTFQVRSNERVTSGDDGKDAFMTIQVKPAIRFLTELEPRSSEELRILATRDGFDPKAQQGGVLFAEAEDRWVLASEFVRGPDERARVTNAKALGHMRVLEGTLENLAGCSTPDGRWFLPVIHSGNGTQIRNWHPPRVLAEQISNDLKRWMPHAPYKARAAAASSALRDLAPALDGLTATRSAEVRAALDRIITLSGDAEALSGSVDQLVETLLASPAIASAIEEEKAEIRRQLEAMALESAERLESEARERLAKDQAETREAIEREQIVLETLRHEIAASEGAIADLRRRHQTETAAFTRSLEALIVRAKKEPAAYAAEWLARFGLSGVVSEPADDPKSNWQDLPVALPFHEPILEGELGRALVRGSPFRNEGLPKFLVMDAAIRSRELVVGLGSKSREMIETWLTGFAPNWVVARVSDPSLLALDDLMPTGSRGASAPLAAAVTRARSAPDQAVVALLDDIDPSAGAFWLPQAARALRCPLTNGLPTNLFFVGLIEGDASNMALSQTRVGELFPLDFDESTSASVSSVIVSREIPLELYHAPLAKNGLIERVSALTTSAKHTFSDEDVARIGAEFSDYLRWVKHGADRPSEDKELANMIARAATKTFRGKN